MKPIFCRPFPSKPFPLRVDTQKHSQRKEREDSLHLIFCLKETKISFSDIKEEKVYINSSYSVSISKIYVILCSRKKIHRFFGKLYEKQTFLEFKIGNQIMT